MNRFIFTIFGIAVGATFSGILGHFAYGMIAGGVVGAGLDVFRWIKEKKREKEERREKEEKREKEERREKEETRASAEQTQKRPSRNHLMKNTKEVSNVPPKNFKREQDEQKK